MSSANDPTITGPLPDGLDEIFCLVGKQDADSCCFFVSSSLGNIMSFLVALFTKGLFSVDDVTSFLVTLFTKGLLSADDKFSCSTFLGLSEGVDSLDDLLEILIGLSLLRLAGGVGEDSSSRILLIFNLAGVS